jgi:putative transposase
MSHSYVSQLMHCVFSTKERRPFITPDLQERLFPYMGGIARKNRMTLIAAGGVEDHMHLLLSLPKTLDIAHAIQLVKGGSSKWIHDEFPERSSFQWQEGYGAFSIGVGEVERTVRYIVGQAEHHKKRDFKTEFVAFLDKHRIEYDPRYIFD